MLFNSVQFLNFFFFVLILYFSLPHRFRWAMLLAASYYFYMCWRPEYLILIVASTLVDYIAGIQMGKTAIKAKRKKYLILSLLINLGLLFSFKYFNFFNESIRAIFNRLNIFYGTPALNVLLPVGISFYTFQTLSYAIDVYRGTRKPERHLGIFALYVAFFPQLVAGPIERSTRLLPQFYKRISFDYKRVTFGLKLMLWGFFQKVVIADRLAIVVDKAYNNPTFYTGIPLLIATYFFAFQIYCDFSGYTDIARGAAQVMGYDLMLNFKRPYFASSIREFWQRWHISLSSWFRDYLYIPLGGNRTVKWRWYYNIFIVFLLSGLWHGANWTFIIWGALHGFYFLFSIWTKNIRMKFATIFNFERFPRLQNLFKVFFTFHLVLFGWIFFRANSISDAGYIVSQVFKGLRSAITNIGGIGIINSILKLGLTQSQFLFAVSSIVFLLLVQVVERQGDIREILAQKSRWVRWGVYLFLILSVMNLGVTNKTPFIYFQF